MIIYNVRKGCSSIDEDRCTIGYLACLVGREYIIFLDFANGVLVHCIHTKRQTKLQPHLLCLPNISLKTIFPYYFLWLTKINFAINNEI